MNKFADKIERLMAQEERYQKVLSKRHPSDVHCPNCDTFILRLKKEPMNQRKTIHTSCPNSECNGDIRIVYHTNQSKAARVFAVEFNKTE
jgi:hypothetical protein